MDCFLPSITVLNDRRKEGRPGRTSCVFRADLGSSLRSFMLLSAMLKNVQPAALRPRKHFINETKDEANPTERKLFP
jgi:hypothetical protein